MSDTIELLDMQRVAGDPALRSEVVDLFDDSFNATGPRDWAFGWSPEEVDRFIFSKPSSGTEFVFCRVGGELVAGGMFSVGKTREVYVPGDVTYSELEAHYESIVHFIEDEAIGGIVAYYHFIATKPSHQGSARLLLGVMRAMTRRMQELIDEGVDIRTVACRTKRGYAFYRIFNALFADGPVMLYDCSHNGVVILTCPADVTIRLFENSDREIARVIRKRGKTEA